MTTRKVTTADKLATVEVMIETLRRPGVIDDRVTILKAIAADLRGRLGNAPSVAEHELERRLSAVERARERGADERGAVIGLGEELVGRWPCVKQALERFGAEVEAEARK